MRLRRPFAMGFVVGLHVSTVQQLTDEQLAAAAAREGSDGPAFVALVERFRQRVWRICYRLLSNEHDASDAAQEVFVRLFLHRAKFEGRSKYSTWVHGIAVRTCLTIRRGRGRNKRWEYWNVMTPQHIVALTVSSLDYAAVHEVWVLFG